MITLGIDPHPPHHSVAALDPQGGVRAVQTFPNTPEGLAAFLAWQASFSPVRVAVEGPTQPFFAAWLAPLLAGGIPVIPVPAQKVRERRGRRKTDAGDAVLVARVLQAEPGLPALQPPAWLRPLQELTRSRAQLAHQLQADRMRLPATETPVVRESLRQVVTSLAQAVEALDAAIAREVRAVAPWLLDLEGVGAVLAGVLLAEVGDVGRFRTPHQFASYCGAAPRPWESGGSKQVRVNPGGNRRLNWALHLMARTRLRTEAGTQAFVARKEQEGKTHREALRALKTYLAREVYAQFQTHFVIPHPPTP